MTSEDAIKILQDKAETAQFTANYIELEALELAINALEERPKGKWLSSTDHWYHTCSECKREILKNGAYESFCPNCGARME